MKSASSLPLQMQALEISKSGITRTGGPECRGNAGCLGALDRWLPLPLGGHCHESFPGQQRMKSYADFNLSSLNSSNTACIRPLQLLLPSQGKGSTHKVGAKQRNKRKEGLPDFKMMELRPGYPGLDSNQNFQIPRALRSLGHGQQIFVPSTWS